MSDLSSEPGLTPQTWGAEQLTRDELLTLAIKLHNATTASVRHANTSADSGQMRQHFAVAAEMSRLWGEAADQLIVRGPEPTAEPENENHAEAG